MAGSPAFSVGPRPARVGPPTEVEIWVGSMNWRGLLNCWWLISFLLVVPILVFLGVVWIRRTGTRYRLTTERLTIVRGLLSRASEDVQLVRMEDVQYFQSFLHRLLGVGTVRVVSSDKTAPDLLIPGILDPGQFKEKMWSLIRERRQGMLFMEQVNPH